MIKDLEWLKREIDKNSQVFSSIREEAYLGLETKVDVDLVNELIYQVEHPELPTIPDYVAAEFEKLDAGGQHSEIENIPYILKLAYGPVFNESEEVLKIFRWIRENPEDYVLAVIYGFTIEKYIVQNNEGTILLIKYDGKVTEPKGHSVNDESWSYHLTEQEIKDFDPRYWEFADPVDENV